MRLGPMVITAYNFRSLNVVTELSVKESMTVQMGIGQVRDEELRKPLG